MSAQVSSYLKKAETWAARAKASRLFLPGVIGGALVALLDQASKLWILNGLKLPELPNGHFEIGRLFDFTYVRNYGASFGMLNGTPLAPLLLSLVAIGVTVALVHWMAGAKRPLPVAGCGLIVGGAVGNLVDRLRFGYVVDFLNFSSFPFPHIKLIDAFPFVSLFNGGFIWVFNVADAAINVGIALLIVDWLILRRREKGEGKREKVQS